MSRMVILILEKYNHTPSKFKFLSFTEVRLALLPQDMIKNTSFRLNRNKIKFTETALVSFGSHLVSSPFHLSPPLVGCN